MIPVAKTPKPICQWKRRANRALRDSPSVGLELCPQDEVGRELEARTWESLRRTEVMSPEKRER